MPHPASRHRRRSTRSHHDKPIFGICRTQTPTNGSIIVHGSQKIALECEEGDATYAESVCTTEELKFYKDNVDPTDMTSLKKLTIEQDPSLKFKSADDTKMVDFVPGDSSKQFSISANLDPK